MKNESNLRQSRCYLCDFIKTKSLRDLGSFLFHGLQSIWVSKAKPLLLLGIVLAIFVTVLFSLSQAGCALVAYALLIAGIHRFWIATVEEIVRNNSIDAMSKEVQEIMSDIAAFNLISAELALALVGTLLWGFGSTSWPCIFGWQCN